MRLRQCIFGNFRGESGAVLGNSGLSSIQFATSRTALSSINWNSWYHDFKHDGKWNCCLYIIASKGDELIQTTGSSDANKWPVPLTAFLPYQSTFNRNKMDIQGAVPQL
jgi:hypothetical protein